tara:strand:- start:291 stop:761 length:471 start_codon:yes stop_codon:yes gene_type:complete
MNNFLKKNIRILAEKFNHKIEYQNDVVVLKNNINEIKLWETDKYGIYISYNIEDSSSKILKSNNEIVYDILLDLLNRKEQKERLTMKTGILLSIEDWIKEEGEFAKDKLEELKKDLKYTKIKSRILGGNRYGAEYYNGLLILTDDLCWGKSNVVTI